MFHNLIKNIGTVALCSLMFCSGLRLFVGTTAIGGIPFNIKDDKIRGGVAWFFS